MYDGGEHTPKLLHCSHTVCLQCLDRIVATFARDTGQFRCPICRELITIPRGGVQAMPPSFLVNQLLDLMARQRREVIPKCSTHHSQVGIHHSPWRNEHIFMHYYLLRSSCSAKPVIRCSAPFAPAAPTSRPARTRA